MSLALRLIAVFAIVLVAVLGTSVALNRRVAAVLERVSTHGANAQQATQLALQAQVHFKKQVQEWKNILLRGADDADFAKYRRLFEEETNKVRTATHQLLAVVPAGGRAWRAARDFDHAHRRLADQYERGLELFRANRTDPFRVDAQVRGIDRAPTDLLDRVVLAVGEWRTHSLSVGGEELRAAQHSALATQIVAFVIAGLFVVVALRFWVALPIATLANAARQIAGGNLGYTVADRTGGAELGELASAFNAMSGRLADLVERALTAAKIEQELQVAETVQAAIIPASHVHRACRLEIVGHYLPASRCGGDWWSYHRVSDTKVLLLIGDVTGHGIPTTLLTASVDACCHELRRTNAELEALPSDAGPSIRQYVADRASISYLLRQLNDIIVRVGQGHLFMTFSAALIDSENNTLTFASAGHESPLLVRKQGDAVVPLYVRPSARLGEARDHRFEEACLPFAPGDTVVWYTDGLVDAANPAGKPFGDGRLLRALRAHRASPVGDLAQRLVGDVQRFTNHASVGDDITVVICRHADSPTLDAEAVKPSGEARPAGAEVSC